MAGVEKTTTTVLHVREHAHARTHMHVKQHNDILSPRVSIKLEKMHNFYKYVCMCVCVFC